MNHYRQTNGVFHATLPEFHWLSPINKVQLTEDNASEYGYEPADSDPHGYGAWLVESGVYLNLINEAYSQAIAQLVSSTPDFERESWPKQELEARAWQADINAPTPYVDLLATNRDVPRTFLLNRILEKVALYEFAHATLTGMRQAREDALNAIDLETVTHDDVFAINCNFTLPEG